MHTRGPEASTQALNEPWPEEFKFETLYTAPPLPAGVCDPKPSAPGKTGRSGTGAAEAANPAERIVKISRVPANRLNTSCTRSFFG